MEYFKCFIEDFNTATMPHIKYYHLESWEMGEYNKQKASKVQSSKKKRSYGDDIDVVDNKEYIFNDEEIRRKELKQLREEEAKKEFQTVISRLSSDKEKQQGLRLQDSLRSKLQLAYKMGNREEVTRLEALLAPEKDVSVSIKHPWA